MSVGAFDVIDFHAHIIPGADHGSASLATSLEQLTFAAAHNVGRIIATPHFYPDRHSVKDFIERRDRAYGELTEAMTAAHPSVALGAEVLICDGIERLDGLDRLCVAGTNIILLELPFSVFNIEYRDSVYRLVKRGYTVVLAHVDRYDPEYIEMLVEVGALMQINADALSGFRVRRHLMDWIASGRVVALGSDIHGADKGAYQRFDKAKRFLLKHGADKYLTEFSDRLIKIF